MIVVEILVGAKGNDDLPPSDCEAWTLVLDIRIERYCTPADRIGCADLHAASYQFIKARSDVNRAQAKHAFPFLLGACHE